MNLLEHLRLHELQSRTAGYFDDADIIREIADAIESSHSWTAVRLAVRRMTREVL